MVEGRGVARDAAVPIRHQTGSLRWWAGTHQISLTIVSTPAPYASTQKRRPYDRSFSRAVAETAWLIAAMSGSSSKTPTTIGRARLYVMSSHDLHAELLQSLYSSSGHTVQKTPETPRPSRQLATPPPHADSSPRDSSGHLCGAWSGRTGDGRGLARREAWHWLGRGVTTPVSWWVARRLGGRREEGGEGSSRQHGDGIVGLAPKAVAELQMLERRARDAAVGARLRAERASLVAIHEEARRAQATGEAGRRRERRGERRARRAGVVAGRAKHRLVGVPGARVPLATDAVVALPGRGEAR